jgi:hypothetical protein
MVTAGALAFGLGWCALRALALYDARLLAMGR